MLSASKLSKFKKYCYVRLKVDELGLSEYESVSVNEYFEPIYKTLYESSEKLHQDFANIKIQTNWFKAKRDYTDFLSGYTSYTENHDIKTGWHNFLALFVITKTMIRRYRDTNILFASLFCVEMLEALNKLDIEIRKTPKPLKLSENSWNQFINIAVLASTISSSYCLYRLLRS